MGIKRWEVDSCCSIRVLQLCKSKKLYELCQQHDLSKTSSGLVGGSLDLFQTQYGVSIIGTLKGLPTGQHGLAVHEGTSCQEPGLVYKVLTLRLQQEQ